MMQGVPAVPGEAALLESERAELEAQFLATRAAARRHTLWGLLGGSPAAVIPLVIAGIHYGVVVACVFMVVVCGVELWRGSRLFNVAAELESRLKETSDAIEALSPLDES